MRPLRPLLRFLGLPALALLALAARAGVPERAVELKDLGVAQLENERPAEAEPAFAEVVKLVPEDPLGYADRAVAALRQQHYDAALTEVDRALAKGPNRADLLALRGEILHWAGKAEEALASFERAAGAAPSDVEILYAAYREATTTAASPEKAQALAGRALDGLARLRPENLVVLLQRGSRAIAQGDRATATASYLRVRELLGSPPPPAAGPSLDAVLAALEKNDPGAARVPALRLENVLKATPMYQGSQRELARGIQGVPVTRFQDEPPPAEWGPPVTVTLRASRLDPLPGDPAGSLVAADFDGDKRPDLARLVAGEHPGLEVRLAANGWKPSPLLPAPGANRLLAADLDNDGALDLLAYGPGAFLVFKGDGKGGFTATPAFGLAGAGATAAAVLDFDGDGDLDLASGGGPGGTADLWSNPGAGALVEIGAQAFPPLPKLPAVRQVVASDLDRDGDLDLLLVCE